MFAIIKTGGKQYRVAEGETIRVEKLAFEQGSTVEFPSLIVSSDVLATGETAAAVKVAAQVMRHVKGEKIYIDKYKSGIQYRRRNGHRQQYTDLKITGIG